MRFARANAIVERAKRKPDRPARALFAQCGVIPPSAQRPVSFPHGRFASRASTLSGGCRRKIAHSPSRSPRCTSAPLPWRCAPSASTHGNDRRSGLLALAMAIVRNSSRRQRVSVYKHCKVTHQTAVASPLSRPPALTAGPLSRVTSRAIVAAPRGRAPNFTRK